MPGSSDGGAHLNTFCGADYTTRVLTEYVDERLPVRAGRAQAVGDARGLHRPVGPRRDPSRRAADLVLLDRVAARGRRRPGWCATSRTGAGRLIWEQHGYVATIVNGEMIIDDGNATGATPGEVLRFNQ